MPSLFTTSSLAFLTVVALGCLPPRPRESQAAKPRSAWRLSNCRWVLTVADPDIRLKWDWESSPSEVAGHDRERASLLCFRYGDRSA